MLTVKEETTGYSQRELANSSYLLSPYSSKRIQVKLF